ncbi:MAG: zf-HC2 domain-containing protein [Planctomycetaceae bacterium]|nr:zf-HC2 domain-containing protein [Planctomycetaceae bacterium]
MDLSQNELLSAYLDGELTAAEQEEVERLLATDPAARQLLEDLRALSATLQSLPQEKVGEDLSHRVLQAAERRMITEGPGESEPSPFAPTPLIRSVFQRFINRRTLAWLSITAVIAVAIAINERWQQRNQGPAVNRAEIARLDDARPSGPPASDAKPADEAREPPSMRAAPSSAAKSGGILKQPASEPPPAATVATVPPASTTWRGDKSGAKGLPEKAASAQPGRVGKALEAEAKDGKNERQATPTFVGKKSGERAMPSEAPEGGLPSQAKAGGRANAPSVLVVQLSVPPAAFRSKAFDKLLEANGVTAFRQDELRRAPKGKETSSARSKSRRADTVYAEATPSQVQAVLAGLAAQPEVFVGVSTEPVEGRPAEEILRRYGRTAEQQSQLTNGGEQQSQSKQTAPPANAAPSARPPQDFSQNVAGPANKPADGSVNENRNQQSMPATAPVNRQQLQQTASTQRVLFVLRLAVPPNAAKAKPEPEPAKGP